jgi:excisionase family DNA binding protein
LKDKENYLEISTEAFTLLQKILDFMARGKSITIVPTDESLTTQQAARMLNVSRPHVVKLLEAGEIPFKMVGSHRRIFLKDLEAYEKKIAKKREKQLRFLTKQAQKLDMGY